MRISVLSKKISPKKIIADLLRGLWSRIFTAVLFSSIGEVEISSNKEYRGVQQLKASLQNTNNVRRKGSGDHNNILCGKNRNSTV